MGGNGEPDGRLVTPRLLTFAAAQVAVGLLLLVAALLWMNGTAARALLLLGLILLFAPVFGLAPLVLKDRRRRR